MKLGNRDTCRHCQDTIMICRIPGGKWLPFNLQMIEAGPDAVDAFVPVRIGSAVALTPIADAAPRQLEGVRWYAQQHRCPQYMRLAAARRQERISARQYVGKIGDALVEHVSLPEPEPGTARE